MRTIEIPPVYLPGTTQISAVQVKIELTNAEGQAIVGFDAAAGYVRSRTITTSDATQSIELPANASLVPTSKWKFTLTAGSVSEEYLVDVEESVTPISLPDLLHPVVVE
jgi:hypothetical protein